MFKILKKKDYEDLVEQLNNAESSLQYRAKKESEYRNKCDSQQEKINSLLNELEQGKIHSEELSKTNSKCLEEIEQFQQRINTLESEVRKLIGTCGGYASTSSKRKTELDKMVFKFSEEKKSLVEIINKQSKEISKLKHPMPIQAYKNDGFRKGERRTKKNYEKKNNR